jgi:hypothetical protein
VPRREARSLLAARTGSYKEIRMNNIFRGLLAGWGAKKMGGGCISTILIFILLWWLLGKF